MRVVSPMRVFDYQNEVEARIGIEQELTRLAPQSGLYTPVVTSSGGGETLTYTTQLGHWVRFGPLVWFAVEIMLATKSGGSGEIQVSLPAMSGAQAPLAVYIDAMAAGWTGAPLAQITGSGVVVARIRELAAGTATAAWTKLGANGAIRLSGVYLAAL